MVTRDAKISQFLSPIPTLSLLNSEQTDNQPQTLVTVSAAIVTGYDILMHSHHQLICCKL